MFFFHSISQKHIYQIDNYSISSGSSSTENREMYREYTKNVLSCFNKDTNHIIINKYAVSGINLIGINAYLNHGERF